MKVIFYICVLGLIFLFLSGAAAQNITESSLEVFNKTHTFTNDFSVNYSTVYADCVYVDEDQDGKVVIDNNTLKYCSYHYKIIKAVKIPDKFSIKAYNSKVNLNLSLDYVNYNISDMSIFFYARGTGEFNISCDNCITHDPVITSCGQTGNDSTNYTLGGNLSCTGTGFTLGTNEVFDCQGYTIDGDDETGDFGFYMWTGEQNTTVKNCIITDFGVGIQIYNNGLNQYNVFENNTILSSSLRGIQLYLGHNNTFRNNVVNGSAQYALFVWASKDSVFLNNKFNNTVGTDYGVLFYSSAINNSFINNTIEKSPIGLEFDTTCSKNRFVNNTIQNSTYYGISLSDGDNNNFTGNKIKFNGQHGIYLYATSTGNNFSSNLICNNNISSGAWYDIYDLDNNSGINNVYDTNISNTISRGAICSAANCTADWMCSTNLTCNLTSFVCYNASSCTESWATNSSNTTGCINFSMSWFNQTYDTAGCNTTITNTSYNATCVCNSTWINVSTTNISQCIDFLWNTSTLQTDISFCNLSNQTVYNYDVACECNSTWSNVSVINLTECVNFTWNTSTLQTDISFCNLSNQTVYDYNVFCNVSGCIADPYTSAWILNYSTECINNSQTNFYFRYEWDNNNCTIFLDYYFKNETVSCGEDLHYWFDVNFALLINIIFFTLILIGILWALGKLMER